MIKAHTLILLMPVLLSAKSVTDLLNCTIPPINDPEGRTIIRVKAGDSESFNAVFSKIKDNTTVLIPDGTYVLNDGGSGHRGQRIKGENITFRSESGDPTNVIIKGRFGFENPAAPDEEMLIVEGTNITIADITLSESRCHGLKLDALRGVENVLIHNVHFLNIGERAVKGVSGRKKGAPKKSKPEDFTGLNKGGVLEYCYFENTKIPKINRPGAHAGGNYIASVDCMVLTDWVFRWNVFKNIKGATGGGRAGLFVWNGCNNVLIENNVFLNCDRSVAYGNPSFIAPVTNSIVRNNFVVCGNGRPFEMCGLQNGEIYNNTLYNPYIGTGGQPERQTIFLERSTGIKVYNNIVMGNIFLYKKTEQPEAQANIFDADSTWFKDARNGDLHLTGKATALAKDKGIKIEALKIDIDGQERIGMPDIGADEL
ncbi:MAG: hypothetical protein GY847_03320 [Proteobacteria bacterium]|nr:hypothetical protein [Pseudomonadota bacterium]